MFTSESHPFTAATSKLAYAQAFAGPTARRRASRPTQRRVTRELAVLRRLRRG